MRTTLDVDDDLLQALKRAALSSHEPVTRLANRLLRAALSSDARRERLPVEVASYDLGRARLPFDNIAETLQIIEGEAFR